MEQISAAWGEMTSPMRQLQIIVAVIVCLALMGMVCSLLRPTRPEDTSDAAYAVRSKLAKSLAPWVTAMMPMTDAIQEGLRESSGLEPLCDMPQPFTDQVKPPQQLTGQLKTIFQEAMAPCNKNPVLLQKTVEEEIAKMITKVAELKKVTDQIEAKVVAKLQSMSGTHSERVGRVESQFDQEPHGLAFQLPQHPG